MKIKNYHHKINSQMRRFNSRDVVNWSIINKNLPFFTSEFPDIDLDVLCEKLLNPIRLDVLHVRAWLNAALRSPKHDWYPLSESDINLKLLNCDLDNYLVSQLPDVLWTLRSVWITDNVKSFNILASLVSNVPNPKNRKDQKWPSGDGYGSSFSTSMKALNLALLEFSKHFSPSWDKIEKIINEIFLRCRWQSEYYLNRITWLINATKLNGIDILDMTFEQKNIFLEINPNNFPNEKIYSEIVKERLNPDIDNKNPIMLYLVNSLDWYDTSAMVARSYGKVDNWDIFNTGFIDSNGNINKPKWLVQSEHKWNNLERLYKAWYRIVYYELIDAASIWKCIKQTAMLRKKINAILINLHGLSKPGTWYLISHNDHVLNAPEWWYCLTWENLNEVNISYAKQYLEKDCKLLSISCASGSDECWQWNSIAYLLADYLKINYKNIIAPMHPVRDDVTIYVDNHGESIEIRWVDFYYDMGYVTREKKRVYPIFDKNLPLLFMKY